MITGWRAKRNGYNERCLLNIHMPSRLGYHSGSDRNVFLLELEEAHSAWPSIKLPSLFACFCALDACEMSVSEISDFCEKLLRSGCVYLCAWGPGCERVHDIMDEIIVGDNPPESSFADIMTTDHAHDSLTEALDFFLLWAEPHDESRADCRSALIVVVANLVWRAEISSYISTQITNQ